MKYQLIIKEIEKKNVEKEAYRQVGEDEKTGKPEYAHVAYEVEEEVRTEVLNVTVKDLSIAEVLEFLSKRSVS